MTQLTEHFSWEETSITSVRSIDNTIPEAVKPAIQKTAVRLEKVRALLGAGIVVNSWYRCIELNRFIGSKDTSQHPKGEAVDFISPKFGTPEDICRKIIANKELINFDQLIFEHAWVHISWNSIPGSVQRGQVLTLLSSGKYASGLTDKNGVSI